MSNKAVIGILLLLAFLTLPLASGQLYIPAWSFWGLDLENIWKFHHCEVRNHPYSSLTNGVLCGDSLARNMNYPPLLYWSFLWMRLFSFDLSLRLWAVFTFVALAACLLAWTRNRDGLPEILFGFLLLLHYPTIFALERANNDIIVVILWTASMLTFSKGRHSGAGVFAGLAVAAKLYPAIPLAVTALSRFGRWKYLAGAAVAGLAAFLAFPIDTLSYRAIVQAFASERPPQHVYSHGLPTFFVPVAVLVIALPLAGTWIAFSLRRSNDPESIRLVFAGALAFATFFSRTSYDYNLITAYPLAIVLFGICRSTEKPVRPAIALGILLLTLFGDRYLYRNSPVLLVLLEAMAIAFAGWTVLQQQDNKKAII